MKTSTTSLSPKQALLEDGYFIQRQVLSKQEVESIRQALHQEAQRLADQTSFKDALLESTAKDDPQAVPVHERFRKLSQLFNLAEVWDCWLANPRVLAHIQAFLGDTILNKYASAFLKPAQIGGPTPWHQDIALWRDNNVNAMNAWLAIDPSTQENGCLQMVPGSHTGDIIPHVTYEDSIHGELPRELCRDLNVVHIDLQPGDVVYWHSNLWHYSPPNTSDQSRMGCGAVWINPDQFSECHSEQSFYWAMRNGQQQDFPAKVYKNQNSKNNETTEPETY